jgi:hypothetical protein
MKEGKTMEDKKETNRLSGEVKEQKTKEVIAVLKGVNLGEAYRLLSRVQEQLIEEIII